MRSLIHRRLRRLEDGARPAAPAWQPPPAVDPDEERRQFAAYLALIDAEATTLPDEFRGSPDPVAWREFVNDVISAGLADQPSEARVMVTRMACDVATDV